MFKGFPKRAAFNGLPNLNFQMNNQAYGFSGCQFWLDAARVDNPVNNTTQSLWTDSIGGSRWVQPTSGSRPIWRSSDSLFNNNPVVECLGNGIFFNLEGALSGFRTGETTIVIVAQATGAVGRNLLATFGTSQGEIVLGGGTNSGVVGTGIYAANTELHGVVGEDTDPHIIVITKNNIVIDGVIRTVSGSQAGNLITTVSFNRLFGNTGGVFALCKVAEILTYNSVANTSKMVAMSDALNQKYVRY